MSGAICGVLASTGGVVIAVGNITASDSQVGSPASMLYRLTSAGVINTEPSSGVVTVRGNWITPQSGMSGYDARATIVSGPTGSGTTTGTFLTWQNLGTTRAWSVNIGAGLGATSLVFTIDIAVAGTTTPIASATITLNATSS